MKTTFLDDIAVYPPFNGFPKEGIKFLKDLKKNNNRNWFNEHKSDYEKYVKLPMQSIIAELRPLIKSFAPEIEVDPKRSIFRIYRDIRFSKNKNPYKTHVAATFQHTMNWKESAGFYLHIEPREIFLGAGMYMPSSVHLKKIRNAIASKSSEFISLINSYKFKKLFGYIEGDKLSRVPKGFESDHPMAEWLKMKQFFISYTMSKEECYKKSFPKKAADLFKEMLPLVRFLNDAII